MNPWHTIPVLLELDGFVLSESRAILLHLAEVHDREGRFVPKGAGVGEARLRARVHMMLYFDMGTFYRAFLDSVVRLY